MTNRFLRNYVIIGLLLMISGGIILYYCLPGISYPEKKKDPAAWDVPDINSLGHTADADLIRYGRELIINTSKYLGPRGTVASLSNGMNCQNCHPEAGTRLNGNCFAQVASGYPKFKPRSGRLESIEFRVNDCMERSLNGHKLDSLSREMRSIVAYLKWLGKDVPKKNKLTGMGIPQLPFLSRAASIDQGKMVYASKCVSCHGTDGLGLLKPDSTGYVYPPLWGSGSYNLSAGLYQVSRIAGYVKYNMPFTTYATEPQLLDEEAWDVAAYVCSLPRPEKFFKNDWPVLASKPVDYPFGPYSDSFSVTQHKYGPFQPIKNAKEKAGK